MSALRRYRILVILAAGLQYYAAASSADTDDGVFLHLLPDPPLNSGFPPRYRSTPARQVFARFRATIPRSAPGFPAAITQLFAATKNPGLSVARLAMVRGRWKDSWGEIPVALEPAGVTLVANRGKHEFDRLVNQMT